MKECQQIHKQSLLDNESICGIIIFILTVTDFYVVENTLATILNDANPLFIFLSSGILAIGLDISVYHCGSLINELEEILKNRRCVLDLAIFIGSYISYVLLKLAIFLDIKGNDAKLILANIALILVPLLTSILSFALSLKTKLEKRENLLCTLQINNVLLNEYANELKEELYELEKANNIDLDKYNNDETLALKNFVILNTDTLKNYSQFELATKINSQESTDYLCEESKEKGDIKHEELKKLNN